MDVTAVCKAVSEVFHQFENVGADVYQGVVFELVENLRDCFANGSYIHFLLSVADIALDISQSVPLGLILNEAITNAIKYAYPKGEHGAVRISLQSRDGNRIELRISDDGKGLPPDFDWRNSPSLGLQLINLLAEQLKGELFIVNKGGLEILLIFKRSDTLI